MNIKSFWYSDIPLNNFNISEYNENEKTIGANCYSTTIK